MKKRQKLLCLATASLVWLAAPIALAGSTPGAEPTAQAAEYTGTEQGASVLRGIEIPDPEEYTGLSRKVLQYTHAFAAIAERTASEDFSEADWAPLEALVDTEHFRREGVFLGPQAEVIDWDTYKYYIGQYGSATEWEGTLRRITEVPGLVYLELEERNTRDGMTDVSNTVTIYEFDDEDRIHRLDVYVMPLP